MNFYESQRVNQIAWWKEFSRQPNWENDKHMWGYQNKVSYAHIVKENWIKLLWGGIQTELPNYLGKTIHKHSGVHNLVSSWIACANLYFPAYCNEEFKSLLLRFLREKTSQNIQKILGIELEFALEGMLSPRELLGEGEGERGSGQTSPDVAFIVETSKGTGLILTECKYTEHSFYRCSARRTSERGDKSGNPDPSKCLEPANNCDYSSIPCHQHVWGRKYLTHFNLSLKGKQTLTRCPAATAGYQLVRQQALANGIYESGKYDFVFSSVSFDRRNQTLINCLSSTGIKDFQKDWANIYEKGSEFTTWHHQDWVCYVRQNSSGSAVVGDWLNYMEKRYGYFD